eukprot:gnl/TRDRNA2_/TRDRNA2_43651_c0_seq1.p1 gnl/TRDRNA2_/TRDRNA2_43651_c0~~gnl/TRDRNA2_/TRDRNA2_43651_c0_seq1.p1  ORF type:complete len:582 (-),score=110.92 gnl/TRDRNA2_/TRDRNA2_43651_c0_seq1:90-1835(-)
MPLRRHETDFTGDDHRYRACDLKRSISDRGNWSSKLSAPGILVDEHDEAVVTLEKALEICQGELADLEDRLQNRASGDLIADSLWRSDCTKLSMCLEEVAADALECSCRRVPGAMDVFEQANSAVEQLAHLLKLAGEDGMMPAVEKCFSPESSVSSFGNMSHSGAAGSKKRSYPDDSNREETEQSSSCVEMAVRTFWLMVWCLITCGGSDPEQPRNTSRSFRPSAEGTPPPERSPRTPAEVVQLVSSAAAASSNGTLATVVEDDSDEGEKIGGRIVSEEGPAGVRPSVVCQLDGSRFETPERESSSSQDRPGLEEEGSFHTPRLMDLLQNTETLLADQPDERMEVPLDAASISAPEVTNTDHPMLSAEVPFDAASISTPPATAAVLQMMRADSFFSEPRAPAAAVPSSHPVPSSDHPTPCEADLPREEPAHEIDELRGPQELSIGQQEEPDVSSHRGDTEGRKGKGKGKSKGKHKGKKGGLECYICGGPHFARDCPAGNRGGGWEPVQRSSYGKSRGMKGGGGRVQGGARDSPQDSAAAQNILNMFEEATMLQEQMLRNWVETPNGVQPLNRGWQSGPQYR